LISIPLIAEALGYQTMPVTRFFHVPKVNFLHGTALCVLYLFYYYHCTVGLFLKAYGKIGTSRDKTLNFSAFPAFLIDSNIREKLRPKNVYIHANQNVYN
jgi:hypothetical protein